MESYWTVTFFVYSKSCGAGDLTSSVPYCTRVYVYRVSGKKKSNGRRLCGPSSAFVRGNRARTSPNTVKSTLPNESVVTSSSRVCRRRRHPYINVLSPLTYFSPVQRANLAPPTFVTAEFRRVNTGPPCLCAHARPQTFQPKIFIVFTRSLCRTDVVDREERRESPPLQRYARSFLYSRTF